ncbi:hypothetical protein QJS04_geneDACA019480 [Acorus gramineus]|uniref:Uncharacterized protein n=1 Tax=Acorus gramineus TaxID=55184 RepID=A0AAV9AAB4_ACOGR|nr:hypothetical protein QJS04_geneDACA019480 [Acorus gramineus]
MQIEAPKDAPIEREPTHLKDSNLIQKSYVTLRHRLDARKYGGRPPTGTPSLAWSSVVVVVSLISGASIVHNFSKPDLAE